MVRTIDGAARRRLLAVAVWQLIRREGLEAVSVRTVAAEAGLSTGSVRHFFPSQSALLVFAMEELIREVTGRIEAAAAVPDLRDRALAMLTELLPVTDRSRGEFFAHLQFVNRAVLDPSLAPVARRSFVESQAFYRRLVGGLQELGVARAEISVDDVAVRLGALLDGLTLQLLLYPDLITADEALRTMTSFVDDLLIHNVGG